MNRWQELNGKPDHEDEWVAGFLETVVCCAGAIVLSLAVGYCLWRWW